MLSARIVCLYAPYDIQTKLTLHTHTCHWLVFLMKTHCVRCQIWTESLYIIQTGCSLQLCRSSLPSKALVRSRNSTCTIYSGQSALRRVFLGVRRVSPVTIIPSNAPHSFTHLPLMLHTLILFHSPVCVFNFKLTTWRPNSAETARTRSTVYITPALTLRLPD